MSRKQDQLQESSQRRLERDESIRKPQVWGRSVHSNTPTGPSYSFSAQNPKTWLSVNDFTEPLTVIWEKIVGDTDSWYTLHWFEEESTGRIRADLEIRFHILCLSAIRHVVGCLGCSYALNGLYSTLIHWSDGTDSWENSETALSNWYSFLQVANSSLLTGAQLGRPVHRQWCLPRRWLVLHWFLTDIAST